MSDTPVNNIDQEIIDKLNLLHDRYNTPEFIKDDPISIPHSFSKREDIEIAGFMAATIAWGNRKAIVKSSRKMMDYMDNDPYNFVYNATDLEIKKLASFVHRTFNGADFIDFVLSLQRIFRLYGNIGNYFEQKFSTYNNIRLAISDFRKEFLSSEHHPHCEKHISNIDKGAACKRLNMYLRWMIRNDDRGVDFGLWNIPSSALYLPLDVHSANISRSLGLLKRKQNDWKAVEEVTYVLRSISPQDPIKYDFALFGAGINQDADVISSLK